MATRYEVVVEQLPENHIPVLREFRRWRGLGLKAAKELYGYVQSNCPCVLIAGVTQDVAENLSRQLADAGATTAVQVSTLETPMTIDPRSDDRYVYHWFSGLQRRS